MILEMMRRGIEFDAEQAFKRVREPGEYETVEEVSIEVMETHFDKFLVMTKGFDTQEVVEQRNQLLKNLAVITIHNSNYVGIRETVSKEVERLRSMHAQSLDNGMGVSQPGR